MSESCQFCGREIEPQEPIFRSEDQEVCHQKCLERKLVGLELKGVKTELVDALLGSFRPAEKKTRFGFLRFREK
ncbi:MAG: hypothetical protein A2600_04710 [Candidatus Lambdaproteobacteria bacterium RIFOXYD1_FULL_56_27]|uniref:Uncharacterized protein n=1 Tax=Candidatus Lambdaproteobacteria bacterium RIFOXYD2_FULL_56_26 TaxID=1817773 RepID=A0A1F6H3W6_9PROT|nr:MAG: hypothetical protein A2426_13775 [Candidatus Lambdaproteobacteria bacterium RIFOXYC1_FULL_56_13]OGH05055.1 MAG: hypothetical protein A2557_08775 [Candidatus Lambdaproteobacteria bacterium RIFOXYD2_FULL_56_26]OGH09520.1 MAG: hypothetical protein A2600_04710 [Candidatus Lambdaproteobacteria bacterium RIFOXYD1_FULL_56_27]